MPESISSTDQMLECSQKQTNLAPSSTIDTINPQRLALNQNASAEIQGQSGTDVLLTGELEALFNSFEGSWSDNDTLLNSSEIIPQYTSGYADLPVGRVAGCDTLFTTSVTHDQYLVDKIVDGVSARLAAMSLHGLTASNVPNEDKTNPLALSNPKHDAEDSDCSWSSRNNFESLYQAIEQDLNDLEDANNKVQVYISQPLDKKKRRIVHTLAHLRQLNRVTLEGKGDRAMLITRANIVCKIPLARRCWNVQRSSLKFNPTTVSVMFPFETPRLQVDSLMDKVFQELPEDCTNFEVALHCPKLTASFNTVAEAQVRYSALRDRAVGDIDFNSVEITFGTWTSWIGSDAPEHATVSATHNCRQGRVIRYDLSYHIDSRTRKEQQSRSSTQSDKKSDHSSHHSQSKISEDDGYTSAASGRSSKRSLSVYQEDLYFSEDPTLSTESNKDIPRKQADLPASEYTASNAKSTKKPRLKEAQMKSSTTALVSESIPKRKKRFPKGEYMCHEPRCGKVFEYAGVRTKHERIHAPATQHPYACTWCEKGFINLKDAERHSKVHLRNKSWWPNILS